MVIRLLFLMLCALAAAPLHAEPRADAWWKHVAVLADDKMEGRLTGTPGYDRAAAYVAGRFRKYGLKPAGTDGYLQPIAFETQVVDAAGSTATLIAKGVETPLAIGAQLLISARGGPRPAATEAPLVFIGYGLHIPEAGHDDFAGVDLKGKIAVFVAGGPQSISGALKSHARAERGKLLEARGAVGFISIDTPKMMEQPWARAVALSTQAGLYFADAALRDVKGVQFAGSFNPAEGERLFAGSGRRFAEIAALADASKPIPGFALGQVLKATVATRLGTAAAANVVGVLEGSDPALKAEHVVLSAHLDGLGIGAPEGGDAIYNGAMDNAAGVASLLEIARGYRKGKVRPRRSILFLAVTAEEKGLLGSRYFARRPSVPKPSLVADINLDMPLPLWPLTSLLALGQEESSLGSDVRAIGVAMGLPVINDPLPDRNSFIRSDQYAFIEQGVPALFPKFGFSRGSAAFDIEKQFRATRYHGPSDDLAQPVNRADAVRFNDFLAALALRVADADQKPRWNTNSFFRRFAKP
ncbi:M28 family metallopeptidase [Sphingomonas sp. 1P06PA]|uniref:M28 family metallopeptidase n=1 Tax=Sphingomonas sp. 1P06PA TaxID=554121 RepID=UPI0039A6CCA4